MFLNAAQTTNKIYVSSMCRHIESRVMQLRARALQRFSTTLTEAFFNFINFQMKIENVKM